MSKNSLIHSFQKNAGEQVRICLTEFKGTDLLDVRIYFLVDEAEEKEPDQPEGEESMDREKSESKIP